MHFTIAQLITVINHDFITLIITGVVLSIISVVVFKYIYRVNLNMQSSEQKVLTEQQAIEIYKQKLEFMKIIRADSGRTRTARIKSKCAELGSRYRVSPKTIWDVWNRKTWVIATASLWAGE